MAKYTDLNDPLVEHTVATHMKKIVSAICSRMDPVSIILRGSFGRGEGSILIQDGQLRILSDYEIDVVTLSPFYRSIFSELSRQLTVELGVNTSLRWVRPDYLYRNRIGPLPIGKAPISISLYESRYGSQTLFGQDVFDGSPPIDHEQISLDSGIVLVLNRMAESLCYRLESNESDINCQRNIYWLNKMILACAESLLVLWGQYHYSYKERGKRFTALAKERLDFLNDQGIILSEFVARATEFKLHPRWELYPGSAKDTWDLVVSLSDMVFRHLIQHAWVCHFREYIEFPELYLRHATESYRDRSPIERCSLKLLDSYKYARRGWFPRGLLLPYDAAEIVYSVVPLLFVGWDYQEGMLQTLLVEVRRRLVHLCPLEVPDTNPEHERNTLCKDLMLVWDNFCVR